MTDDPDLDDAIDTAIKRTNEAEKDVRRAIDERAIPPEPVVRKVVHRADDLDELARQGSADDPTPTEAPAER